MVVKNDIKWFLLVVSYPMHGQTKITVRSSQHKPVTLVKLWATILYKYFKDSGVFQYDGCHVSTIITSLVMQQLCIQYPYLCLPSHLSAGTFIIH